MKIDALRFLAAFWVLIFHFHPPVYTDFLPTQLEFVGTALWKLSVAIFDGPAAVIVFFVISGYCIHGGYHREAVLKPINYYASRFARIGIPLVILFFLVQPLRTGTNYLNSVLWSLYCEMVYYALYPVLRARFRFLGELIVGSALLGGIMVAAVRLFSHPACDNCVYETYGVAGTALVYSAGWISGCLIAETQRNAHRFLVQGAFSRLTMLLKSGIDGFAGVFQTRLVLLRIVVVAAGAVIMTVSSTSTSKPAFIPYITSDITLPTFQFLAALWIAVETMTPPTTRIWTWLASLGAWSYSLYLCHKTTLSLLEAMHYDPSTRSAWFVQMALALALSYGFYRFVERPAHLLSQRLRKHTTDAPPATA
ncbi:MULTISPECIES: acyltransferase [Paraburkholderia]|uniref:Acyltransferase n=1 Tax=Paraburkholderia madseniana TaxID=2599607 RepID=A0AAP5BLB7_9BURK|nr:MULTISPECIES: acyltransferase [Paraburkholderia]MCX4150072.1 acyltransferase [Paraburkholderia madseniana]MDN7153007.1 acyltransferase [Paraburkholderia sp. WS6]MDQ6411889.1 acyltransferase [Paraburkholderia madseniana]